MSTSAKCMAVVLISLVTSACGKKDAASQESFAKRAAKFATEQALDAMEGVSEVIEERGEQTSERLTKAAGEVIAGAADGTKEVADIRGEEIGANLKSASDRISKGIEKETPAQLEQTAKP